MRRKTARRLAAPLLGPLVGASLLLGSAGAAAADEPAPQYTLDVFYCTLTGPDGEPVEGNAVPAGSEILLFEGWLATTRGQVQGFVNNVTWVLSVNGESVDVTPYLSGVIPFGPYFADLFVVSAGILNSGETLVTHHDLILRAAAFDGFFHYPIGSVYGGGVDCTVTAA